MEKVFEAMACAEEHKVPFATYLLKGEAEHWWRATRDSIVLEDGEPLTWSIFLQVFRDYYFPESVRYAKELEFMELI